MQEVFQNFFRIFLIFFAKFDKKKTNILCRTKKFLLLHTLRDSKFVSSLHQEGRCAEIDEQNRKVSPRKFVKPLDEVFELWYTKDNINGKKEGRSWNRIRKHHTF